MSTERPKQMTEERKAAIMQRAREVQERLKRTYDTPEARAERAARQERIRKEGIHARIYGPTPAASKPPKPTVDTEAPPPDLNRERFVSIERARELCDFAWNSVKFTSGAHGNGEPNLAGNCVGKARWLQRHLGGTLIVGFRKDSEKGGRHAALLFASEGKLYVADWGEVMPVDEYPFYVEGFRT